jgi:hypothetical protein
MKIVNLKLEGFMGYLQPMSFVLLGEEVLECNFALLVLMRDKYLLHKH